MFGTGKHSMTSVVSATVDGGHQQNLRDPVIIFLRREPCDKKGKLTLNRALLQCIMYTLPLNYGACF
jgi:hypothetical protein